MLHNIFIDLKDDKSDEWDCNDVVTVMVHLIGVKKIPEEQRLFEPIPDGTPRGWRKDQLKDYVYETQILQYNFTHNSSSFSEESWESIQNEFKDKMSL